VSHLPGGSELALPAVELSAGDFIDRRGDPYPLADLRAHWPLGAWYEAVPIVGGKNEHVRLRTRDGTVFLRRSYRSKRRDELRAQLALMRLLRAGGLPVPVVVPTTDGEDDAQIHGRLYTVTCALDGGPYDDSSARHLRALGSTLAAYHRLVRHLPATDGQPWIAEELAARATLPGDPELSEHARRVARDLQRLLPDLPRCIVHGGARRGSLLFAGDTVAGVLDFDSAHPDVRVLDLAVAAHDVGKVYTQLGAADHKVALDLGRVQGLLQGYAGAGGVVTAAEAAALPLLIEAKRLKRALGRLHRHERGDPLSSNDLAKIELERNRLRWLAAHREQLAAACTAAGNGAAHHVR
jgi:homoserine kinase type II